MSNINGRVDSLNRDVFTTLQTIKSRNQGRSTLSERDAQELSTAIKRDGKIDAAEGDLLLELTQEKTQAVNVGAQKTSNFSPGDLVFASSAGRTRQILQDTLVPETHMKALLNKGPEGIKELTQLYRSSPAHAERVVGFLADQAATAWEGSKITNGYGPLRSLITNAYSGVNQLQGEENAAGRNMLYQAVARVDRNADGSNGAIPDFLYNWIRPGGVI